MIHEKGIELIKKYEGFRAKAYLCPAGVPTIGYGTTIYPNGSHVKIGDGPISEKLGTEYLGHDVAKFEKVVDRLVTTKINDFQRAALVVFTYNVGEIALKKSTLLIKVNANPNDLSIIGEFNKWVYANGVKLKGLVKRRGEEAELYFYNNI